MDPDDRGAQGLTDPPVDGKPPSDPVRTDGTGGADNMSEPGIPDVSIGVVIGSRIGPYTIRSLLGRGGMGEVYRASDEQLGRDVAIKILRSVRLIDPQQRLRLDREARTLAALNHPHIAAIYGIDDSAGIRALVLELVEGPTLADLLVNGPLPLKQTLTIGRQIAEALEAAHEKGIVHRDLKPSNIKVTRDRGVKVLDFGIAKVTQGDLGSPLAVCDTKEGVIVGTAAYMSPEQARAENVDKRSDIWSFGCVLYEMLCGVRAFSGHGWAEVIGNVLHQDPDWDLLPAGTPATVRHLVQRCLQKDPYERLRDIGEARIELQEAVAGMTSTASGTRMSVAPPRTALRSRSGITAVVGLGLLIAVIAYWVSQTRESAPLAGRPRQVTVASGWQADPALSPDGSFIAYASNESGHANIWIIDATGGNPLRLTSGEGTHRRPTWFPDGSAVAYVSKKGQQGSIWKVLRLGGAPTLLVADGSDPAISPNGAFIAFTRPASSGFDRIAVAPIHDTSNARFITSDADGLWNHNQPAWSPDGRMICYVAQNALWIVDMDGGRPRQLTTDSEYDHEPAWSADGRYVYFSSFREGTEALWRVRASGGKPTRITMGTGPERQPSVSRDGTRLAYSTISSTSDVALLDLQSGKQVEVTGVKNEYRPALAPDASAVAFASDRWGDQIDLWVQPLLNNAPQGQATRLTDQQGFANYPSYSPDGRWITYARVDGERREIWVVSARGGAPVQITDGEGGKFHPSWSPDGKRLAFAAQRESVYQIHVVPVSDGKPAGPQATVLSGPAVCESPAWSPDGSQIAYVSSRQVWLVPVDGAHPAQRLAFTSGALRVRWNRVSQRLYASGFWDGERVSVRMVELATGSMTALRHPIVLGDNQEYPDFDVSPDERLVAFDLERRRGAIWVVDSKPAS